jgi:tRNA-dihydrouridine synthase B
MPFHWRACLRRLGVQMLTVHGRTREQGYKGEAEYDTIAAVKAAVQYSGGGQWRHHSPEKAREVLGHGGRRHHDWPRRAGSALDISRNCPLSGHRHPPGAALVSRSQTPVGGAFVRPLQPVRRIHRRALGAQAHWLVPARIAGRRGFSQRMNALQDSVSQVAGGRAIFGWFEREDGPHPVKRRCGQHKRTRHDGMCCMSKEAA